MVVVVVDVLFCSLRSSRRSRLRMRRRGRRMRRKEKTTKSRRKLKERRRGGSMRREEHGCGSPGYRETGCDAEVAIVKLTTALGTFTFTFTPYFLRKSPFHSAPSLADSPTDHSRTSTAFYLSIHHTKWFSWDEARFSSPHSTPPWFFTERYAHITKLPRDKATLSLTALTHPRTPSSHLARVTSTQEPRPCDISGSLANWVVQKGMVKPSKRSQPPPNQTEGLVIQPTGIEDCGTTLKHRYHLRNGRSPGLGNYDRQDGACLNSR
ncbi:hypothetical protein DFH27DRAFT_213297 [Peziza echinospora]|nr:hypothetical protein DFH27DRAFT_213297 [Peziza echinospora]